MSHPHPIPHPMKSALLALTASGLLCGLLPAAVTEVAMTSNPQLVKFLGDVSDDHLANASANTSRALAHGDLNGDGIDDIVIGCEDQGTTYSPGAVYIVFGRSSWSSTTPRMATIKDVKLTGSGNTGSDNSLSSAVCVGDVNGDGIDDLIVGSKKASNGSTAFAGAVLVFFGSSSWSTTLSPSNANVRISGAYAGGQLGFAITTGDFNNDGIDDIVASAPYHTANSLTSCGQVYMFFGRTTWSSSSLALTDADTVLNGPRANSQFALRLWKGDFNGDNKDDLFLAAYHDDDPSVSFPGYSGVVWGLLGRSSWPSSLNATSGNVDFYVNGESTIYGLGYCGCCGDVNGDGIDDCIVAATDSPSPRTVIFYGRTGFTGLSSNMVSAAADYIINYGNPNNNNGAPTSIASGDIDGDGIDDIAVGFGSSSPHGSSASGSVTIHYGRSSWATDEVDDVKYTGEATGDQCGMAVDVADFTGDGKADLLFNAPYADPTSTSNAGKAYLIAGAASPAVLSMTKSGTRLTLSTSSRSGRTCRLQVSTDLVTWSDLETWNSTGSAHSYSETSATTKRFYRVVTNPR